MIFILAVKLFLSDPAGCAVVKTSGYLIYKLIINGLLENPIDLNGSGIMPQKIIKILKNFFESFFRLNLLKKSLCVFISIILCAMLFFTILIRVFRIFSKYLIRIWFLKIKPWTFGRRSNLWCLDYDLWLENRLKNNQAEK